MKKFLAFPFLILLLLLGCTSSKDLKEEKGSEGHKEKGNEGLQDDPEHPAVRIISEGKIDKDSDPFRLKSAEMSGDRIRFFVSYSGGCKEHGFELLSNKEYGKSLPPTVNLYLVHDNNGDACRSVVPDTLTFDVSALRHERSDALLLRTEGLERALRYEY